MFAWLTRETYCMRVYRLCSKASLTVYRISHVATSLNLNSIRKHRVVQLIVQECWSICNAAVGQGTCFPTSYPTVCIWCPICLKT